MSNVFNQIENTKLGSSTFNLSHERKFSLNFGELVPILNLPVVPGDDISLGVSQMMRFAPMIAPVMHKINVYTHYFFVPNRILWKGWEKFINQKGQNSDVLKPVVQEIPKLTLVGGDSTNNQFESYPGDLTDYMGLPTGSVGEHNVSILPFAAYQMIYKDYYRDQNLEGPSNDNLEAEFWFNESVWPLGARISDGEGDNPDQVINGLLPNTDEIGVLRDFLITKRNRAWQHDYFTSALPWTQKGDPVTIPLGTAAPIMFMPGEDGTKMYDENGDLIPVDGDDDNLAIDAAGNLIAKGGGTLGDVRAYLDNSENLLADLEAASSATIIDLRNAFSVQKFLEKNARTGSRYFEFIQAHFGIRPSDGTLQRPEYLGGASNPVVISEVLQTSSTDSEPTPQGNMSGHGISAGKGAGFKYFCKEHGYIIGIMSVLPKTAYQQGIPREWQKFDQFDFFTPEFQNIGEQPIYNRELMANHPNPEEVFGYTPRYSEYKYIPSSVHGEMRTTLDFWHAGRIFDSENPPALNKDFITMKQEDVNRIFAVPQADEHLYCFLNHDIKARRKMQFFGSPGITRL